MCRAVCRNDSPVDYKAKFLPLVVVSVVWHVQCARRRTAPELRDSAFGRGRDGSPVFLRRRLRCGHAVREEEKDRKITMAGSPASGEDVQAEYIGTTA